jgi:hypothetical protein
MIDTVINARIKKICLVFIGSFGWFWFTTQVVSTNSVSTQFEGVLGGDFETLGLHLGIDVSFVKVV